MKISPNNPCPCGSKIKYKKCCQRYHKGAIAQHAVELMKSRYSAYVSRETMYIVNTTHNENPHYQIDKKSWKQELDTFCKSVEFIGLEIIENNENENRAIVEFKAYMTNGMLHERSQFVRDEGKWYYLDGDIYN